MPFLMRHVELNPLCAATLSHSVEALLRDEQFQIVDEQAITSARMEWISFGMSPGKSRPRRFFEIS